MDPGLVGGLLLITSSGSKGGQGGHGPLCLLNISHKKDGYQRRPHRFHISWSPLTRPVDPLLITYEKS